MASYNHSVVVVWPVALTNQVQAINTSLGYDSGEGVPLYTATPFVLPEEIDPEEIDPEAPPPEPEEYPEYTYELTHRGLHTWATSEYVALATGQVYPNPMPEGVTQESIDSLLANITVSVDVGDLTPRQHFQTIIDFLELTKEAV